MGRKALVTVAVFVVALVVAVQVGVWLRDWRASERFPPQGQFVKVSGGWVHVEIFGEGPDLILIHGASGSTRDFTFDLAHRLKDRFRVIVMDRPGLGWTDRATSLAGGAFNRKGESPARQAEMLQETADALDVRNPIVVGHSFGGAVALAWALARPDETAALVLLAGASQPWPGELALQYRVMDTFLGDLLVIPLVSAFTPPALVRDSVRSIFAPQAVPDGYVDHIGPTLSLRRDVLRANAQQVNSLRPFVEEMSAQYPGLDIPVEILHGTADTIVPLHIHSEPLAAQLPDARLTVLEGIGHMPQHAAPEDTIAAIDRAATRAGLR